MAYEITMLRAYVYMSYLKFSRADCFSRTLFQTICSLRVISEFL